MQELAHIAEPVIVAIGISLGLWLLQREFRAAAHRLAAAEAVNRELLSETMTQNKVFDNKLLALRDAFKGQIEEMRLLFQGAFASLIAANETDLLTAIASLKTLTESQSAFLREALQELGEHNRGADIRIRSLAHLLRVPHEIHQLTRGRVAEEPLPLGQITVLDASDAAAGAYPHPSRSDEATHPEIDKALRTPGWSIRYPDGRVERGIE